jgi:hypothetical protein
MSLGECGGLGGQTGTMAALACGDWYRDLCHGHRALSVPNCHRFCYVSHGIRHAACLEHVCPGDGSCCHGDAQKPKWKCHRLAVALGERCVEHQNKNEGYNANFKRRSKGQRAQNRARDRMKAQAQQAQDACDPTLWEHIYDELAVEEQEQVAFQVPMHQSRGKTAAVIARQRISKQLSVKKRKTKE